MRQTLLHLAIRLSGLTVTKPAEWVSRQVGCPFNQNIFNFYRHKSSPVTAPRDGSFFFHINVRFFKFSLDFSPIFPIVHNTSLRCKLFLLIIEFLLVKRVLGCYRGDRAQGVSPVLLLKIHWKSWLNLMGRSFRVILEEGVVAGPWRRRYFYSPLTHNSAAQLVRLLHLVWVDQQLTLIIRHTLAKDLLISVEDLSECFPKVEVALTLLHLLHSWLPIGKGAIERFWVIPAEKFTACADDAYLTLCVEVGLATWLVRSLWSRTHLK